MNPLTQTVVAGLMSGALYSLLGIGLLLMFRTSGILNVAHGEAFAIAGVTAATLTQYGLPLFPALFLALIIAAIFSMSLYSFILRTRSHWPFDTLILTTLGVAFVSRGVMILLIGTDPVSFSQMFMSSPIQFAGGSIQIQGVALVVLGFGLTAAVAWFLTSTRSGKQLFATAENPFAAELLGVDVERARLLSFGIAGLLAGIAAALVIPLIAVDFQSGLSMTIRGFIAASIAGMSPVGVLFSGLGLGLFESMVGTYLGALFQDPVMFGVLILVAVWQSRNIRFGGGLRA